MSTPVLSEIENGFSEVPQPDSGHIVVSSSAGSLEGQGIQGDFAGRDWRSLGVEELRRNSSSLFLLTPEAFRYYLPAFMKASISDPEKADVIPETLVFALDPATGGEEKKKSLQSLGPAQKRAVAAFLGWLEEDDPRGADAVRAVRKHYVA